MPSNPIRRLALAAVSAAIVLAACGGGGGTTATSAPQDEGIVIKASEFAFDPSSLTATAGQDLKVTLKNTGTVEHDFTIDALNVQIKVAIGGEATQTLTGLAAGTYDFHCSIPGHKEAGMVGTLVVK